MPRFLLLCCFLILTFLLFACTKKEGARKKAIKTTTFEMAREYEENQAAFELQFKGEYVEIHGQIMRIGKNEVLVRQMHPNSGPVGPNGGWVMPPRHAWIDIKCNVSGGDASKLATMRKGQQTKVIGKYKEIFFGTISLSDCVFEVAPDVAL